MDGRVPRTADGKPDLSGDWIRADRDPLPQELAGVVTARGETTRGVVVEPAVTPFAQDSNSPPLATFFDLGTNVAGGLPFKPQAELILNYKGRPLKQKYFPDFLLFDKIVLEIKSVKELAKQTAGKAEEQQDSVLADAQQLNIDSLYRLPPLRMRPPTDGSAGDTP